MDNARIRGTHQYSFRAGEWGEIIAVKISQPEKLEPRVVFVVLYDDGMADTIPLSDSENYEISATPSTNLQE